MALRKPRRRFRLGQFEALDLTFRGLHIVAIPMTAEGTISVAYDNKKMEARRYGAIVTFHKKGEVPTLTPLMGKKLPDDFPGSGLIISRAFEDEYSSLTRHVNVRDGSRQWLEMRKAFMAGARLMLGAMEEAGGADLDEDVAVAYLEERKAEFQAFFEEGGGAFEGLGETAI